MKRAQGLRHKVKGKRIKGKNAGGWRRKAEAKSGSIRSIGSAGSNSTNPRNAINPTNVFLTQRPNNGLWRQERKKDKGERIKAEYGIQKTE